jgi:chromosome segregation ATPase
VDQQTSALAAQSEATRDLLSGQVELVRTKIDDMASELVARVRSVADTDIVASIQVEAEAIREANRRQLQTQFESSREDWNRLADELRSRIQEEIETALRDREQALQARSAAILDIVTQAEQAGEGLSGGIEAADVKAQQLLSHVSAATEATRTLSDATVRSQQLLSDLTSREEAANEIHARIAAQSEDAGARVASVGEAIQRALADADGRARRLHDELAEKTELGIRALRDEAASVSRSIADAADGLARMRDELAVEADRNIAKVNNAADAAKQSIVEIADRAAQMQDELAAEADNGVARVNGAADSAQRAISEALDDIAERAARAEQTVQRLQKKQEETEQTIQRAREFSDEAAAAVQSLDRSIRDLDSRSDAIGNRMNELAEQIGDAQTTRAQLETVTDETRKYVSQIHGNAEAARKLIAEQARRTEQHRDALQRLTEEIAKGQSVAQHIESVEDGIMQAYAQLAERSETATAVFDRLAELVKRIDQQEREIIAQDGVLASMSEEREAMEMRMQQLQTGIESLRAELNALLAAPQKLVCDAKNQATQLHEVCRAVKRVFAGLSQASLDARQKIDELSRLEEVATALQDWVGQTARAQQQLAAALEPARPQRTSAGRLPSQPSPTASPAPVVNPSLQTTTAPPAGAAKGIAASAATQKARAAKIDQLIREARRQAEAETGQAKQLAT